MQITDYAASAQQMLIVYMLPIYGQNNGGIIFRIKRLKFMKKKPEDSCIFNWKL